MIEPVGALSAVAVFVSALLPEVVVRCVCAVVPGNVVLVVLGWWGNTFLVLLGYLLLGASEHA